MGFENPSFTKEKSAEASFELKTVTARELKPGDRLPKESGEDLEIERIEEVEESEVDKTLGKKHLHFVAKSVDTGKEETWTWYDNSTVTMKIKK